MSTHEPDAVSGGAASRPDAVAEPPDESPLALGEAAMRRLGYRAVDAIVDRAVGLRRDVPWMGGDREELEALLREPPPEAGAPAETVLDLATSRVLPRAGRIDHPRFFAFVPSSPTWPSVVADILATGYNVFQGTWLESAGPSQVELVVLDWFRQWLGFPEEAGGLLTSGGSAANLDALVTAREAAGSPGEPTVYVSDQGHSSIVRAARMIGIAGDAVRTIPSDDGYRMRVDRLARAIAEDRGAGRSPLFVCGNGGATNTGAVDPLPEISDLCRDEDLWFHVDAAYGGFTILTEAGRLELRGIERADSVTLDPHKWLFQPYETGCLMVRDVRRLEAAFSVRPEYLQDTRLGERQVNFADRGLQLSRSFRALRIWMSIKTLGVAAFREAVQEGMDLASRAGERVTSSASLELLTPPALGVVCFRFRPHGESSDPELEALNQAIQDRINEEGTAMMSSTRLRGTYSLRLCILNYHSRWEDVEATLERIEEVGAELSRP